MENNSVLSHTFFNNEDVFKTNFNREKINGHNPSLSSVILNLITEDGENLFHYLQSFDLLSVTNLIVLPSNHHYYYDENDLKNVRTIINLKKLNLVNDIDAFLNDLCSIIPPDVNFIGCFSDNKTLTGNRFLSALSTRFNNFLDSKTYHNIHKNDVSELLEKYNFKIVDITEMDGLTYFYSQNVRQPIEIRA